MTRTDRTIERPPVGARDRVGPRAGSLGASVEGSLQLRSHKEPPFGVLRPRPRGFSLIEMMAVVSILGVIAVLAVPQFAPVTRRQRVESSVDVVAEFVARARLLAVTSGRCVRVRIATPQPVRLVAEKLNIYDCMDSGADPVSTPRADGTAPLVSNLWLPAFELTLEERSIEVTFNDDGTPRQPIRAGGATLPALNAGWGPDTILVYRPTGRLWSDHDPVTNQDPSTAGNGIYDDDGVLLVRSRNAPTEKAYVIAASHGPICTVRLGKALIGAAGAYQCP